MRNHDPTEKQNISYYKHFCDFEDNRADNIVIS
jgi:hypothetical protein